MDYAAPGDQYECSPDARGGGAVTITVLPVTLSLVRIPKHRLSHFVHPIIKLILGDASSATFLNISTNTSEVSIIAREADLASFVRIARRDNRRIRRRLERRTAVRASADDEGLSTSDGRAGGAPASASPARQSRRERALQPVEVSSSWSALQIDSHGEQLGDASARIREISWLLSGISILYQSSYTTDYIFVQSRLLPEVLSILSTANFITLSSIPPHLSDRISTIVSSSRGPSTRSASPHPIPPTEEPEDLVAALTLDDASLPPRPRRGTASSHASLHSMLLAKSARSSIIETTPSPPPTQRSTTRSTLSLYRPSVSIVPSDLVVVGLSEQFESHADVWKMKLIKMLFFGDMLGEERAGERGRERERRGREFDFDVEDLLGEGEGEEEDGQSGDGSELGYSTTSASSSDSSTSTSRSTSNHSYHSTKSSVSPPSSPLLESPSHSSSKCSAPSAFFSLTRTADGTSLTSDVHVLAKLFEGQRDLIYCGDEFDRLERAMACGEEGVGFLKCLHVDLKDFDLDRHGLVNRFSDVLHSNNIHHLYCSTFKTANLLVDGKDAVRAQKLLSEC